MADEDTEAIADARETRELVLAASLRLALEVVEHVEEGKVQAATRAETLPAGGFSWELRAHFWHENNFVRVTGQPRPDSQVVHSVEAMAVVMGNDSASFDVQVPIEWTRLASKAAAEL